MHLFNIFCVIYLCNVTEVKCKGGNFLNITDYSIENFNNSIDNENVDNNENEKLVELVLSGDKDAYEIIVQKYRDVIFATVCSIVKNHHTAEDITQDTFLEGYLKINTLIDKKKIGVWLIKIARNKCYNYLNRSPESRREVELDEFLPDTQSNAELITPENHFFDKYDRYVIERVLKNLPDTHRNTTVMFYFKKYSRKKIAEVLNIPEGTVKRRLHDARVKLKREFELMAGDENYVPTAEFEKNIIRSVNNISMINIYKPTETGIKEMKFGDIDDFSGTRIEMIAPTDGEIKDIARVTGVDRRFLESVLYDEEVENNSKNIAAVQFVSETGKDEKIGFILNNDMIISVSQSERKSDSILNLAVQGIYSLVNLSGYINLDFADVYSILNGGGRYAHVATGYGKGEEKVENVIKEMVSSPSCEKLLANSRGIIVNVIVSNNISLEDIDRVMTMLRRKLHPDTSLIFGISFDNSLEDEVKVVVIAMDSEEPIYEI